MPIFGIVLLTACVKSVRRADPPVKGEVFGKEVLVHRDMEFMGTKVGRRVQHAIRHDETIIKLHHHVGRQMPDAVVFTLAKLLHAGQELLLRHE